MIGTGMLCFGGFVLFCFVLLGLRGLLGCAWESWVLSFWGTGFFLSFSLLLDFLDFFFYLF